jgi:FkbM family methyltransferase
MSTLHTFGVPKFTTAYGLELAEYGWAGQTAYYFELDHQYATSKATMKDLFDYYLVKNHWGKWIQPGMTVIDIGGFAGDTAIPMMTQCRSTVLTVEPNHTIRPYLEFNCEVNRHLGKFIVAKEAVTNRHTDDLLFRDHQNGLCNGGILDETWDVETASRVNAASGAELVVSGMPLIDMCQKYLTEEEIRNVGFVKTDTEGHDIEIIRSSSDFLLQYKPVLFTEWFFLYSTADVAEMFKAIEHIGYQAFYPETMQPADPGVRSEDLVCIHKSNL